MHLGRADVDGGGGEVDSHASAQVGQLQCSWECALTAKMSPCPRAEANRLRAEETAAKKAPPKSTPKKAPQKAPALAALWGHLIRQ